MAETLKRGDLAEKLFEQACQSAGIHWCRVPVARVPGLRRPDYKVRFGDCAAMVEVKQIEPNDDDLDRERKLRAGQTVLIQHMPGSRLRSAIRDSAGQLRRPSKLGIPTAVAIFNNSGLHVCSDPYYVKTAMYGLNAIVLAVPSLPASPYRIGEKSAGSAGLTDQHNTSVSAVIIIGVRNGSANLIVYHNHHARVRINPDHLHGHVFAQFVLDCAPDGETTWLEVNSGSD